MRLLSILRSKISLVQARHYFLSCCVLLLGVTIGFLVVTQSQADDRYDEILIDIEPNSNIPLSLRGPQLELPTIAYPPQKIDSMLLQTTTPVGSKAYEVILRRSLSNILADIQHRCGLTSQSETLNHIESFLKTDTDVLSILDAWCITDSLATKYDYTDPLIATKLPFIKVLAVYHAGSREKVTQAVRQLPLKSRFADQSTWGSWSDIVVYAEYHGLLDRVVGEELSALQGFSSQELGLLFGEDNELGEEVFLHELLDKRSEFEATRYLQNVLLYHPTNQKILRTVLTRIQRSSSIHHEALLKKLLRGITQDSKEILQLKNRIEGVL